MARNLSNPSQEICVDIVKFEVSSDNGDEPHELSPSSINSTTISDSQHQPADLCHSIGAGSDSRSLTETNLCTTPVRDSLDYSNKTVPPSSELIRLFGPTTSAPIDIDGNPILQAGSLASQLCPLGPKERCTPSQAQAMGEQLLSLMATHESDGTPLPFELQNTFDIFHRCLAVAYGTFFLNLYTKANAPCVLCHGCKSLYPPGQYIHHSCLALPTNIVPCRSRMWRRCLVPLMSQDMDKIDQKERWKFVLEKFSHASMAVGKRNIAHLTVEPQLLEMPECKKGKFVEKSSKGNKSSKKIGKVGNMEGNTDNSSLANSTVEKISSENSTNSINTTGTVSPSLMVDDNSTATIYTCISDDEQPEEALFNDVQKSCSLVGSTNGVMDIVKDLAREVSKLDQELMDTKEKLRRAEAQLKAVTSGDSLSEQFVQSLLAQEKLTAEKKGLAKRLQLEEQKSSKLEKKLCKIQILNTEISNELKL